MPITFILLLLGLACGLAGKFCIDTLGGSGYHWLFYWEILCLLHFFSNVWTSALFFILHGPVNVSQGMKISTMFPYWIRRLLFYCIILLCLPLLSGLMPFASPGTWKDHFKLLIHDLLSSTGDWSFKECGMQMKSCRQQILTCLSSYFVDIPSSLCSWASRLLQRHVSCILLSNYFTS